MISKKSTQSPEQDKKSSLHLRSRINAISKLQAPQRDFLLQTKGMLSNIDANHYESE
jgi:hypothetical protein